VVREFSDVYFFTKDLDLAASTMDPFSADPLPDIGQNSNVSLGSKRNSSISNVFKKVGRDANSFNQIPQGIVISKDNFISCANSRK
jgi:hypothetical protein